MALTLSEQLMSLGGLHLIKFNLKINQFTSNLQLQFS